MRHTHRFEYATSAHLGNGTRWFEYRCACGEVRHTYRDLSWKVLVRWNGTWRVWFYGSRAACLRYADRSNTLWRLMRPGRANAVRYRAVKRTTTREKYAA